MRSAHDCSDGGLAITLAECSFDTGGIGADVAVDDVSASGNADINRAAALFGESASRAVVSVAPDASADVLRRAASAGVPARVIGRTGGRELRIAVGGRVAISVSVSEAERVWSSAIERYFERQVA